MLEHHLNKYKGGGPNVTKGGSLPQATFISHISLIQSLFYLGPLRSKHKLNLWKRYCIRI